ncbi:hypothetical protein ADUPG1_012459 [Aduncisulcus paluster]|uniref:Protein kinase domain-containing protein n=1 Tax=Aduncisulcus paluster TaxID=2918883 RepID=A0ABQ5K3R4_9EUKA|nr:hypothetical protein ADUPG1_012459 [Aduncisulcus paluster]
MHLSTHFSSSTLFPNLKRFKSWKALLCVFILVLCLSSSVSAAKTELINDHQQIFFSSLETELESVIDVTPTAMIWLNASCLAWFAIFFLFWKFVLSPCFPQLNPSTDPKNVFFFYSGAIGAFIGSTLIIWLSLLITSSTSIDTDLKITSIIGLVIGAINTIYSVIAFYKVVKIYDYGVYFCLFLGIAPFLACGSSMSFGFFFHPIYFTIPLGLLISSFILTWGADFDVNYTKFLVSNAISIGIPSFLLLIVGLNRSDLLSVIIGGIFFFVVLSWVIIVSLLGVHPKISMIIISVFASVASFGLFMIHNYKEPVQFFFCIAPFLACGSSMSFGFFFHPIYFTIPLGLLISSFILTWGADFDVNYTKFLVSNAISIGIPSFLLLIVGLNRSDLLSVIIGGIFFFVVLSWVIIVSLLGVHPKISMIIISVFASVASFGLFMIHNYKEPVQFFFFLVFLSLLADGFFIIVVQMCQSRVKAKDCSKLLFNSFVVFVFTVITGVGMGIFVRFINTHPDLSWNCFGIFLMGLFFSIISCVGHYMDTFSYNWRDFLLRCPFLGHYCELVRCSPEDINDNYLSICIFQFFFFLVFLSLLADGFFIIVVQMCQSRVKAKDCSKLLFNSFVVFVFTVITGVGMGIFVRFINTHPDLSWNCFGIFLMGLFFSIISCVGHYMDTSNQNVRVTTHITRNKTHHDGEEEQDSDEDHEIDAINTGYVSIDSIVDLLGERIFEGPLTLVCGIIWLPLIVIPTIIWASSDTWLFPYLIPICLGIVCLFWMVSGWEPYGDFVTDSSATQQLPQNKQRHYLDGNGEDIDKAVVGYSYGDAMSNLEDVDGDNPLRVFQFLSVAIVCVFVALWFYYVPSVLWTFLIIGILCFVIFFVSFCIAHSRSYSKGTRDQRETWRKKEERRLEKKEKNRKNVIQSIQEDMEQDEEEFYVDHEKGEEEEEEEEEEIIPMTSHMERSMRKNKQRKTTKQQLMVGKTYHQTKKPAVKRGMGKRAVQMKSAPVQGRKKTMSSPTKKEGDGIPYFDDHKRSDRVRQILHKRTEAKPQKKQKKEKKEKHSHSSESSTDDATRHQASLSSSGDPTAFKVVHAGIPLDSAVISLKREKHHPIADSMTLTSSFGMKSLCIIGTGAFGEVLLVRIPGVAEPCILKRMLGKADNSIIKKCRKEFRFQSKLFMNPKCFNRIPRPMYIFDLLDGDFQGVYGFIMEFCIGGSVSSFAKSWCADGKYESGVTSTSSKYSNDDERDDESSYVSDDSTSSVGEFDPMSLNPVKVAALCVGMIECLDDVFEAKKSLVHRDIKPENFLVRVDTKSQTCSIVLGDLGLAQIQHSVTTSSISQTFLETTSTRRALKQQQRSKSSRVQRERIRDRDLEREEEEETVEEEEGSERDVCGTLVYNAYEAIRFGEHSQISDAHSLGMSILSLFLGKPPFIEEISDIGFKNGHLFIERLASMLSRKITGMLLESPLFKSLLTIDGGKYKPLHSCFKNIFTALTLKNHKRRMSVHTAREKVQSIKSLLPAIGEGWNIPTIGDIITSHREVYGKPGWDSRVESACQVM